MPSNGSLLFPLPTYVVTADCVADVSDTTDSTTTVGKDDASSYCVDRNTLSDTCANDTCGNNVGVAAVEHVQNASGPPPNMRFFPVTWGGAVHRRWDPNLVHEEQVGTTSVNETNVSAREGSRRKERESEIPSNAVLDTTEPAEGLKKTDEKDSTAATQSNKNVVKRAKTVKSKKKKRRVDVAEDDDAPWPDDVELGVPFAVPRKPTF